MKVCNKKITQKEYDRLDDEAGAEYKKITDTAEAEYNKIRDIADAEYKKIVGTAWAEYQKKEKELERRLHKMLKLKRR